MSVTSNLLDTTPDGVYGTACDTKPILVVLVLYQMEATKSPALLSLVQALSETGLASKLSLLIYDNSPAQSSVSDELPLPWSYKHNPANGGLSAAYGTALSQAVKDGHEWLLLLDQDTVLNASYLHELRRCLFEMEGNPQCASIVPKLCAGNEIISPARVLWGGSSSPVDKRMTGIPAWELVALNSGALLRVSIVHALGGFTSEFWLDYLDHWIFNRIHRTGHSVCVMDAQLHHKLSVMNMSTMPIARYQNILRAEGRFYQRCKSIPENIVYCMRLLARAVKMLILPSTRVFFRPTLIHLTRQLHLQRMVRFEND